VFCVGLLCSSCLTIVINLEVCVCGSNYCVPGERLELVSSVYVRTRALYHLSAVCQAGQILHLLYLSFVLSSCDLVCS